MLLFAVDVAPQPQNLQQIAQSLGAQLGLSGPAPLSPVPFVDGDVKLSWLGQPTAGGSLPGVPDLQAVNPIGHAHLEGDGPRRQVRLALSQDGASFLRDAAQRGVQLQLDWRLTFQHKLDGARIWAACDSVGAWQILRREADQSGAAPTDPVDATHDLVSGNAARVVVEQLDGLLADDSRDLLEANGRDEFSRRLGALFQSTPFPAAGDADGAQRYQAALAGALTFALDGSSPLRVDNTSSSPLMLPTDPNAWIRDPDWHQHP